MNLEKIEICVRPKSVFVRDAKAEHAAVCAVIESREKHSFASAVRSAGERRFGALHPLEGSNVYNAGEREVAEESARRSANYIDVPDAAGKQHRPVVVTLGVSVDRLVDGNAINP